jgi:hypothetical protein
MIFYDVYFRNYHWQFCFNTLWSWRDLLASTFLTHFVAFWSKVSLCALGWTGPHCVAQAGLNLQYSCCSLLNAGITSMCHHIQVIQFTMQQNPLSQNKIYFETWRVWIRFCLALVIRTTQYIYIHLHQLITNENYYFKEKAMATCLDLCFCSYIQTMN